MPNALIDALIPRAAIIPGTVSVYGDSTTFGGAYKDDPTEVWDPVTLRYTPTLCERMAQRAAGKIKGVTDYSRGGNSFALNWAGTGADGPLFGGLTFLQHILSVDTGEICVIALGGNDLPGGWNDWGDYQGGIGADYLNVAAGCKQHVDAAQGAGKKVLLVGTPYLNCDSLSGHFQIPLAAAISVGQRMRNCNTAIRTLAGLYQVPNISTHGWGGDGKIREGTAQDVPDGVHRKQNYLMAVADYMADEVVNIFGLGS